jgi:hypothetical protein
LLLAGGHVCATENGSDLKIGPSHRDQRKWVWFNSSGDQVTLRETLRLHPVETIIQAPSRKRLIANEIRV